MAFKTSTNLVVDLDDTLIKIDLFKESLVRSFFLNPMAFFKCLFYILSNNISFAKVYLSKIVNQNPKYLPYNDEVISIVRNYRSKGYKVLLATGASKTYADSVSNYLGLFDEVIASEQGINNIGHIKLNRIKKSVKDFIYIGDSKRDIPIWDDCKKAILVCSKNNLAKVLKDKKVNILKAINVKKPNLKVIFKALRIHQWVKNILLFLPVFADHSFSFDVIIKTFFGFLAFSFLASGIYIYNDIIDLNHDRKHVSKKNRPLASAQISIFISLFISMILLASSFFLSFKIDMGFFVITILYVILNILYSNLLKKQYILDVLTLTSFYAFRLISGHLINDISFSSWILSFSIFLFFSLGLLKRYVDLKVSTKNYKKSLGGRGYRAGDEAIIIPIGVSSGLISILTLILYNGSDEIGLKYQSPIILMILVPLILYWISRIWFLAFRGKVLIDPVLFTVKDLQSYLVLLFSVITFITAKFI